MVAAHRNKDGGCCSTTIWTKGIASVDRSTQDVTRSVNLYKSRTIPGLDKFVRTMLSVLNDAVSVDISISAPQPQLVYLWSEHGRDGSRLDFVYVMESRRSTLLRP